MSPLSSIPARLWRAAARLPLLSLLLAASAALATLALALDALARPGGGHSYSGGGSSSGGSSSGGGGGGGGDGDAIFFLIWLCIRHPQIGIPVAIVVGIIWTVKKVKGRGQKEWSTAEARPVRPQAPRRPEPARRGTPRQQLANLRKQDPDFSTVLFEDFLYSLFTKVHEARGAGQLATLAPYLTPLVRQGLEGQVGGLVDVTGVVIGAMRISAVSLAADSSSVTVEFESNLTESVRRGNGPVAQQAYWITEQWQLARPSTARSRPPDKARTIGCPACGAPLDAIQGNSCSFCQKQVDTGEFDWVVLSVLVLRREPRGPQLTGTVEEVGTDLPTVVEPNAARRLQQLSSRDPAFEFPALQQRVALIWSELQLAWSGRDWMKVRPFVSDGLFQTQLYWIHTYLSAGLTNVLANGQISAIELAAVSSDRFFDAITVRLHASGLDYTVADAAPDKVVSGSKSRPRAYTEYWTLIRATGKQGAPRVDKACPNCGAGLKVGMAGSCEFCGAKVTGGEFDWVLSRIEQDEEYTG